MNLSAVLSPSPALKTFKIKSSSQNSLIYATNRRFSTPFSSFSISRNPFKLQKAQNFSGFYGKNLRVPFWSKSKFCFFVSAEKNGGGSTESGLDKAEEEARGQSTMPDRFRPLTKEAPDKPVRWPWYIGTCYNSSVSIQFYVYFCQYICACGIDCSSLVLCGKLHFGIICRS